MATSEADSRVGLVREVAYFRGIGIGPAEPRRRLVALDPSFWGFHSRTFTKRRSSVYVEKPCFPVYGHWPQDGELDMENKRQTDREVLSGKSFLHFRGPAIASETMCRSLCICIN